MALTSGPGFVGSLDGYRERLNGGRVGVPERVDLQVQLPRTRDVACAARRALRRWCAHRLGEDELADAELLVSEVATNALLHGDGQISMRAQLHDDRLLVSVSDQGCGFVRDVHPGDGSHLGGWGLGIVDRLARRWGVLDGGAQVWFELAVGNGLTADEH